MKISKFFTFLLTFLVANISSFNYENNSIHKKNSNVIVNNVEQEGVYVATRTNASILEADGIKDDAYNMTSAITISSFTHPNDNPLQATAEMYLLWDDNYIYVFIDVNDNTYHGYDSSKFIEENDSIELVVDLYHEAEYWFNGYGGEYRNEWYGNGARMCEGMYKIAAGVGKATPDSTIQGMYYMWDANKNLGSYCSIKDTDGYTVEYKIAVGQDSSLYLKKDREIGIGVKIYDRYDLNNNASVTTLEDKNDNQVFQPRSLSHVVLSEGGHTPSQRDVINLEGRDKYIARKTDEYIVADGIKDDAWDAAQAIDLIYVRQFGNENIGRMTIYMLWDEDYFYLFADIKDNTINICPKNDSFNYNNYDTVGFCLDLLRDTTVENFDTGDYKTSVKFGGDYRGEPGPMCEGFWAVTRGSNSLTIGTHWMSDDQNTRSRSSFYSVSNDFGYTVEMKLYAGNDKTLFMKEGRKIGVGLNVSDQYLENHNTSATVSHAVLDNKNFPNNDQAFGKVWAQGPCALSEVTLEGYVSDENFENDNIERKDFNASRVLSDTKISIDGKMDEVYNTTSEILIDTLVSGNTTTKGKARIMWTKGYVYLYVDVIDNTIGKIDIPSASDSVIVAIDLANDNDEKTNIWGINDSSGKEGIFVTNPGKATFGYGKGNLYERHLSRVKSIIKDDNTGYTVEMRIEIGSNVNIENQEISLGIIIQDDMDCNGTSIEGKVATNTQQDKVFRYKGVLDNVKLIPNLNETKGEVNDADSIDYKPSSSNDSSDKNEENYNSSSNITSSNDNSSLSINNSSSNIDNNEKENNGKDLLMIIIGIVSLVVISLIGLFVAKIRRKNNA